MPSAIVNPPRGSGRRRGRPKKALSRAFFKNIKASSIPDIRALCRQLDYECSEQRQHVEFYNDVERYSAGFMTTTKMPHTRPLRWTNSNHQDLLIEMTTSFLNAEGRGMFYWPDDAEHEDYGRRHQYVKDSRIILQTMLQLFFQITDESPNDHTPAMAPTTNVEAGDANPPIPEPEQAPRQEGPDHVYPLGPVHINVNREGAIDDPINLDSLSHNNETGPEEYTLTEAADRVPLRRPPRASVEDALDEFFCQSTNVTNDPRDRNSSPDALAPVASPRTNAPFPTEANADRGQSQNNSKRPAQYPEGAQNRPTKRQKGKQAIYGGFNGRFGDLSHGARQSNGHTVLGSRSRRQFGQRRGSLNSARGEPSRVNADRPLFVNPNQTVKPNQGPKTSGGLLCTLPVSRQRLEGLAGGCENNMQGGLSSASSSQQSQLVPLRDPGPSQQGTDRNIYPTGTADWPGPGSFERALSRDSRPPTAVKLLKTHLDFSVTSPGGRNSNWVPRIGLSQMSLRRLVEEVPLHCDFSWLRISLQMPGLIVDRDISVGDEERFEIVLARFSDIINAFKREHADSNMLVVFEIVIRALEGCGRD
ncbi:hypothetical protein AUP68_09557 [Ilyonectria robusta]